MKKWLITVMWPIRCLGCPRKTAGLESASYPIINQVSPSDQRTMSTISMSIKINLFFFTDSIEYSFMLYRHFFILRTNSNIQWKWNKPSDVIKDWGRISFQYSLFPQSGLFTRSRSHSGLSGKGLKNERCFQFTRNTNVQAWSTWSPFKHVLPWTQ